MNKLCCRVNPKLYCEECHSIWCDDCLDVNQWDDISFSHHKLPEDKYTARGWACPVAGEVSPKLQRSDWYYEHPTILTKKVTRYG